MPAEMGKIERTDRPRNYHKVDLIRLRKKKRNIADRIVLQAHPDIGRTRRFTLLMIIHYLLPAGRAVLFIHGSQHVLIKLPLPRKT